MLLVEHGQAILFLRRKALERWKMKMIGVLMGDPKVIDLFPMYRSSWT
nr:hypothetical protein [Edaphobacter aggregans]